jgi:hypothetical protein
MRAKALLPDTDCWINYGQYWFDCPKGCCHGRRVHPQPRQAAQHRAKLWSQFLYRDTGGTEYEGSTASSEITKTFEELLAHHATVLGIQSVPGHHVVWRAN